MKKEKTIIYKILTMFKNIYKVKKFNIDILYNYLYILFFHSVIY